MSFFNALLDTEEGEWALGLMTAWLHVEEQGGGIRYCVVCFGCYTLQVRKILVFYTFSYIILRLLECQVTYIFCVTI